MSSKKTTANQAPAKPAPSYILVARKYGLESEFIAEVEHYLSEGYLPCPGFVTTTNFPRCHFQAMFRVVND